MLDATKGAMRRLIRQTPLIGSLTIYLKRVFVSKSISKDHFDTKGFSFKRLSLDSTSDIETKSFRQIQNLLNYTKTSESSYSALRYPAGYHTIEISGHRLVGQRNPAERLELVPVDFQGKTVVDIGCNQGGMLFQLDGLLKWGIGLDYDGRMINAAHRIRAFRQSSNLNFFVFDLEREPLDLVEDFLPESRVDVVFLLSVCMWIKNWREVIEFAARISDSILFETNGTAEQQTAQLKHLKTLFRSVVLLKATSDDDPRQKRRKLLLCDGPKTS